MQRHCVYVLEVNIVKLSVLHKMICRLSVILIKEMGKIKKFV
jgi:hypothetical protein